MIDFILRPIKCNFGRDKVYYRMIDRIFGFIPNNIELYKLALIHKSASVDIGSRQSVNNERLEFLGDAVIESVTSDYVYIEYPDYDEGSLTQLRSKIVSRQSLNAIAQKIGLDRCVHYNRTGNFSQKNIFGDAFEAMMGAIYLDQGYDFVNRLLINRIYADNLSLEEVDGSETDFKSRLIEWCQKHRHRVHFRTRPMSGASSSRQFSSIVMIDNIEVGHGFGSNKKEAEQNAAQSVTHSVSDDDCARLLDKLDRMEMRGTIGKLSAESAAKPSAPATTSAEKPADESKGEDAPKRSRRGRRRKPAVAETEHGVALEAAAVVEEEQLPAVAEPVAETVAEVAVEEKKPARKPRRTRKPKTEQPVEDAAIETAAEPVAEPVAEPEKAVRKPRRARKPKTEQPVEATAIEAAVEPVAEPVAEPEKAVRKPRRARKPKTEQDAVQTSAEADE